MTRASTTRRVRCIECRWVDGGHNARCRWARAGVLPPGGHGVGHAHAARCHLTGIVVLPRRRA